jgi:hypothetical protein
MRIARGIFYLFFGDAAQRRRVRHELARLSASLFGDFPLSEDNKRWREDKDFLENYRRLSQGNPYSQDRKYTLREFLRMTADVDGCLAECGCYQGATAWFMASEAPGAEFHIFDSFEGLSEPGAEDAPEEKHVRIWLKGDMSASEVYVRDILKEFKCIHYHKGWIPEKFNEVEDKQFRLVHIDVDLFQPTLDSMEFFYERMSRGGVLVLDDYGFTTCPGAYRAVDEYMRDKAEYVLSLPTGQGVIIKQ